MIGRFVCAQSAAAAGLGWVCFLQSCSQKAEDLREGGGDRWFDEVLVIEVEQCNTVGRDREACDKVENADAFVPERPAEKRDALKDRQCMGISTARRRRCGVSSQCSSFGSEKHGKPGRRPIRSTQRLSEA